MAEKNRKYNAIKIQYSCCGINMKVYGSSVMLDNFSSTCWWAVSVDKKSRMNALHIKKGVFRMLQSRAEQSGLILLEE